MKSKEIMRARRTKAESVDSPTAAKARKPRVRGTVTAAYHRVRSAIERACVARGEVQWTNGYRAAASPLSPAEDERLHRKEMAQWELSDLCCGVDVERAIAAYARALRRQWERSK